MNAKLVLNFGLLALLNLAFFKYLKALAGQNFTPSGEIKFVIKFAAKAKHGERRFVINYAKQIELSLFK